MSLDAEKIRKLAQERKQQTENLQESEASACRAKLDEELQLRENFASLRASMWASAKRGEVQIGWDDENLPIRNEDKEWLKARGFWVSAVRLRQGYGEWLNDQVIERRDELHTSCHRVVSENRRLDHLPDDSFFSLNPLFSLFEKIWESTAHHEEKEPWLDAFRAEVGRIGDKFAAGDASLRSRLNELCEQFFELKRFERKLREVETDNEFLVSESLTSGLRISWLGGTHLNFDDFELSAETLWSIAINWEGISAAIEQEMRAQLDSNFNSFRFEITSGFRGEIFLIHQEGDGAHLRVYSLPLLIEEFKARGFFLVVDWKRLGSEPEKSGSESELDRIQDLLNTMAAECLHPEYGQENFEELDLCIRLTW